MIKSPSPHPCIAPFGRPAFCGIFASFSLLLITINDVVMVALPFFVHMYIFLLYDRTCFVMII